MEPIIDTLRVVDIMGEFELLCKFPLMSDFVLRIVIKCLAGEKNNAKHIIFNDVYKIWHLTT